MDTAPSIEFAKRIADAFGESLDYLAGEGILSKLDKKTVKRLQEIESLKEDDKYHFFAIVDAFLRDATARKAYASYVIAPRYSIPLCAKRTDNKPVV